MVKSSNNYPKKLYLIGFSGSGKSTIGPLLANKLNYKFIDTDQLIERESKKSIAEIFESSGERGFRKLEAEIIRKITSSPERLVISLGGGAYTKPENRDLIKKSGSTIYLSCSVSEIYRRLENKSDRPLLGGTRIEKLNKIKNLLSRRLLSYQLADFSLSTTNRTAVETVKLILSKLKESYGHC